MPLGEVERWARRRGLLHVAGLDEAGRGPLAGPVVAACVVLPRGSLRRLRGLTDSKLLSPPHRQRLFDKMPSVARLVGVGVASPAEIDTLNILQASRLAMSRALDEVLAAATRADLPLPDLIAVDGRFPVDTPHPIPQETFVKGDSRSENIAAASVVAKVTRDRLMEALDERYPAYGFAAHKGYPTQAHRVALRALGPCPAHRRSFKLL